MLHGASYPVRRLLVANRGEIACRIMRTARRMNIETLAVFSEADRDSMHVQLADQAYQVGTGSEPQRSYLNQDELLRVACANKANAIHPGYGFLSENSEFCERCNAAKLIFVGPKADAIRAMGIKNKSKQIMVRAGVPVVPGYHGEEQSDERLVEEARAIGFPVLIKPVRGGGGKGMRIVRKLSEFIDALESSRRESIKAFNDQSMLIERYIERPRHIEVQVFGDMYGNYVHLFERDCSVQRRHQKIIEEAPAPGLDTTRRHELGQMAVAAARAVNYQGAGTVEFIMDRDTGEFYFMEMNTRLQVEHPITEMVTSTDLVEWQLRVASGESLPKRQDEIHLDGHAFEARIYAEDPSADFLPQTGRLDYIALPAGLMSHHVDNEAFIEGESTKRHNQIRLDTGTRQGDLVSPFYDPMIAKLIVWGRNRNEALKRTHLALADYAILGLPTNIRFLQQLTTNESFIQANVGTDFIELHQSELLCKHVTQTRVTENELGKEVIAEIGATVFILLDSATHLSQLELSTSELRAFRTMGQWGPKSEFKDFKLNVSGIERNLFVRFIALANYQGELSILDPDGQLIFKGRIKKHVNRRSDLTLGISLNDGRELFKFTQRSPVLSSGQETKLLLRSEIQRETHEIKLRYDNPLAHDEATLKDSQGDRLQARAPMPGVIEKVLVSVGDQVDEGKSLVILSAMKMEYIIKSSSCGRIAEINCKQGDFVAKNSLLVKLNEE